MNDAEPSTSGLQAHTFKNKFEEKKTRQRLFTVDQTEPDTFSFLSPTQVHESTVHNQSSIIDDNYGEELTTLDSFSTPVLSEATNISVDFESRENLKNEVQQ